MFQKNRSFANALCLLLLGPAMCLAGEPGKAPPVFATAPDTPPPIDDATTPTTNVDVKVDEQEPAKSALGWVKEDVEPETGRVEKLVTPLTQWVEGKIQQIDIVKPSAYLRKSEVNDSSGIALREAIQTAREHYPGTVLSADKIESEGSLSYQIKILSDDGVVKTVSVSGSPKADEGSE